MLLYANSVRGRRPDQSSCWYIVAVDAEVLFQGLVNVLSLSITFQVIS